MDYFHRLEAAYRQVICSACVQEKRADGEACQELADILTSTLPRADERMTHAIMRDLARQLLLERRTKIELARGMLQLARESGELQRKVQTLCSPVVDPNNDQWDVFPEGRKFMVLLLSGRDMALALGLPTRLHVGVNREQGRFQVGGTLGEQEERPAERTGERASSARGRRGGRRQEQRGRARGAYQPTGITATVEDEDETNPAGFDKAIEMLAMYEMAEEEGSKKGQ